MTIKVNFQAGSYYADDLINQFKGLFNDGVCKGLVVAEHSPNNLSVDVSAGTCMKAGYFVNSDAITNVPISSNISGYNRIDSVVIDVDANLITTVQGIPSSSPVAPVITGNKLVLANVLVANNVSVISNSNITPIVKSESRTGGIMMKFGKSPVNTNPSGQCIGNAVFDTPFDNSCLVVIAIDNGDKAYSYGTYNYAKTGFTWAANHSNDTIAPVYIAIGY